MSLDPVTAGTEVRDRLVRFLSDQTDQCGPPETCRTRSTAVTIPRQLSLTTPVHCGTEFASRRSPVRSRYAPSFGIRSPTGFGFPGMTVSHAPRHSVAVEFVRRGAPGDVGGQCHSSGVMRRTRRSLSRDLCLDDRLRWSSGAYRVRVAVNDPPAAVLEAKDGRASKRNTCRFLAAAHLRLETL
jgi:hypothetical protein